MSKQFDCSDACQLWNRFHRCTHVFLEKHKNLPNSEFYKDNFCIVLFQSFLRESTNVVPKIQTCLYRNYNLLLDISSCIFRNCDLPTSDYD